MDRENSFQENGFEEAEKLHGKLVHVINEWLKSPGVVEMEWAIVYSALVFVLNRLTIGSIDQITTSKKSSAFVLKGVIKAFERHIEGLKNGD